MTLLVAVFVVPALAGIAAAFGFFLAPKNGATIEKSQPLRECSALLVLLTLDVALRLIDFLALSFHFEDSQERLCS